MVKNLPFLEQPANINSNLKVARDASVNKISISKYGRFLVSGCSDGELTMIADPNLVSNAWLCMKYNLNLKRVNILIFNTTYVKHSLFEVGNKSSQMPTNNQRIFFRKRGNLFLRRLDLARLKRFGILRKTVWCYLLKTIFYIEPIGSIVNLLNLILLISGY